MKIQIIGFSGSGKSTLARDLSERFSVPVLFLDSVFWMEGWNIRPIEDQIRTVEGFLNENRNGWVIDGNYSKICYDRRLQEADMIVFLNFSRIRCLCRILKRWRQNIGKTRFSMPEGCEEKIDWEFIRFSVFDSRTKSAKEKYEKARAAHPVKFIEIKNPKSLERFTSGLRLPAEFGSETKEELF